MAGWGTPTWTACLLTIGGKMCDTGAACKRHVDRTQAANHRGMQRNTPYLSQAVQPPKIMLPPSTPTVCLTPCSALHNSTYTEQMFYSHCILAHLFIFTQYKLYTEIAQPYTSILVNYTASIFLIVYSLLLYNVLYIVSSQPPDVPPLPKSLFW